MGIDTSLGFNLFGRDVSASDVLDKFSRKAKMAGNDFDVFGRNASGFTGVMTKGFLGVGAALGGAFAVTSVMQSGLQYLQDAATAAIADEKSMVALSTAMDNVGLSSQNAIAEDFVKDLMLATGTADDELRPALQKLVTATGDLDESQRLLNLTLDISAATGKDVATVSLAMAKASAGNIGALTRLGAPIDANIIKTKDFGAAVGVLTDKFGGQAAAAADTYGGQLKRVQAAAAEAQETIGYALLDAINSASDAFGGTGGMVEGITTAGETLADFVAGLGQATTQLAEFLSAAGQLGIGLAGADTSLGDMAMTALEFMPIIGAQIQGYQKLTESGGEYRATQDAIKASIAGSEALYAGYITSMDGAAVAERGVALEADDAAEALNDMKSSFDALNNALGVQDKMDGFRLSLLNIKNDIDKTSRSLDDNNVAGLKNRDTIRQVFSDAEAAALAWGEQNGKTTAEVETRFGTMTVNIRQKLIDQGFKPQDIDQFLGGLELWTSQTQALALGLSEGQAAASMRLAGQAFADQTERGFSSEFGAGGKAYSAIQARMTALAESMKRDTTITVTTISRSVYESQVPAAARRASGGPVDAGMPYVVGERGPELFIPSGNGGGSIIPNGGTTPIGAGRGGMTVNVNVGGSVVQERDLAVSVRDSIAQLMRRRGIDPSVIGV